MTKRSIIAQLPEEHRNWIETELRERGFSNYEKLAAELTERLQADGIDLKITTSQIKNYGKSYSENLQQLREGLDLARTLADECDDEGVFNDALLRLMQDKLMRVLLESPEDLNVYRLGHVIADISRSSIQQQRQRAVMTEKARTVADSVANRVKKAGLTPLAIDSIRRDILGITE